MGLVVISNRVPVPTGDSAAGGLTVAVQDALAERGGVWFGWSGKDGSATRSQGPDIVQDGTIRFATVDLDEADLGAYYHGYANSVLWPLFHEHLDAVDHRERFRIAYADVNEYFARHATPLIGPDDTVWVHDYHLVPLGAALRESGVSSRIGFFLHTPFPPWDVLRALPRARTLLEAFFAYDLTGLQTTIDVRHFAEALRKGLGASVNESAGTAEYDGIRMRFGAFPIGIDVDATARDARTSRRTRAVRLLLEALGGRRLIIGADRLDYTKGIVKRLRAFGRFLDLHGSDPEDEPLYLQVAAPSREEVDRYRTMARRLELEAGRINGAYNSAHWAPLRIMTRAVPRELLLGYFSVADIGLVTPLRDGMNLVAKEFLAAQTPHDPGVLVLSSLAGAAEELSGAAVMVNPYDLEGVADGIDRALRMPLAERRQKWERGMDALHANTAQAWHDRFLTTLAGTEFPTGRPPPRVPAPRRRRTRRQSDTGARTAESPEGDTPTSAA